MSKISEVGHAKNAANFNHLIAFADGFGTAYNPSKASLTLTALQATYDEALAALNNVISKNVSFTNAVNERSILFGNVKTFATRVIAALKVSDASAELIDDAQTIIRKIRGGRAKAILPVDPASPPPANHSTSQQSFDLMLQHLSSLIALVSAEESFDPKEDDLKVDALNTRLADMLDKNHKVVVAYTAVTNARIARTKTLYQARTGLVDTAINVKEYVKSLYGAGSDEYKHVRKIRFRTEK